MAMLVSSSWVLQLLLSLLIVCVCLRQPTYAAVEVPRLRRKRGAGAGVKLEALTKGLFSKFAAAQKKLAKLAGRKFKTGSSQPKEDTDEENDSQPDCGDEDPCEQNDKADDNGEGCGQESPCDAPCAAEGPCGDNDNNGDGNDENDGSGHDKDEDDDDDDDDVNNDNDNNDNDNDTVGPPNSMLRVLLTMRRRQQQQRQQPLNPLHLNPLSVPAISLAQQVQAQQLQQRAQMMGLPVNPGSVPLTANAVPLASMLPMGRLTAGFTPPLLPGLALQQQLAAVQALSQRMNTAPSTARSQSQATALHVHVQPSPISPDSAATRAKTIANLANLTQAVQSSKNNLTIATWRLHAAEAEKRKRQDVVLQKSIELFKMKAGVTNLQERIESTTAEIADLKKHVEVSTDRLSKAQKSLDKSMAKFMDATEELVDAKMTARQSGQQQAGVSMDVGEDDQNSNANLGQAASMLAAAVQNGDSGNGAVPMAMFARYGAAI